MEDGMTPKLPKEYSDFRRKQILEAAWDCFVEKGYKGTTVREIARKMKASTGVIYNYFKGKEEVLMALRELNLENNRRMFSRMEDKETAREAILELFRSNLECCPVDELQKSAQGNIVLWSEALKNESLREMMNSFYYDLEDNISRFVEEGLKKKEIPRDLDPKATAAFILSLILGLQLQIALVDEIDAGAYIEGIKNILFTLIWKKV